MKVSILCNTHNHEAYIASALDSFLSQKTNFDYEICVHDDASTDKTPFILKAYQAKYPKIIKLILQNENQFTLGKIIMELNATQATGDYIAICDGDDQFTDPYKLQKQADLLDKDPSLSLIISAYTQVSVSSFLKPSLIQHYPKDRILTLSDLLRIPHRAYGSNTYMYRRIHQIMPETFRTLRFTDLPRLLYSASIGNIYYMKEPTALYRRGVSESWSLTQIKNPSVYVQNQKRLQVFYRDLDHVTQGQYTLYIDQRLILSELNIALKTHDKQNFYRLLSDPKLSYLSVESKKRYIREIKYPKLVQFYRALRLKVWK